MEDTECAVASLHEVRKPLDTSSRRPVGVTVSRTHSLVLIHSSHGKRERKRGYHTVVFFFTKGNIH